jgi:hypothetical protein
MSSEFINVHIFDSKLINSFKSSKIYSLQDKKEMILKFLNKLNNNEAKNMVKIIYDDMFKDNGGDNYQPENKIDCTDILADILNKDYEEILPLIEEQLADAFKLGKCPSGRVTRLLQIWNIFD